MLEQAKVECPECEATESVDRRNFLTIVGGTAVTLASLHAVPQLSAQQPGAPAQPAPAARTTKPAEALIRELYQGLTPAQRFVLALVLFLNVTMLGCLALLVFQKITLPF